MLWSNPNSWAEPPWKSHLAVKRMLKLVWNLPNGTGVRSSHATKRKGKYQQQREGLQLTFHTCIYTNMTYVLQAQFLHGHFLKRTKCMHISYDTSLITPWNSVEAKKPPVNPASLPMKVCRRSSKAIMSRFDPQVNWGEFTSDHQRFPPRDGERIDKRISGGIPPWNMNDWNPQANGGLEKNCPFPTLGKGTTSSKLSSQQILLCHVASQDSIIQREGKTMTTKICKKNSNKKHSASLNFQVHHCQVIRNTSWLFKFQKMLPLLMDGPHGSKLYLH